MSGLLAKIVAFRTLLTTVLVTGMVIGLSFVTSVLLARVLGPEGRGLLLAVIFWPALLAGILNLSFNEAISYHVAKARREDREPQVIKAGFALLAFLSIAAIPICMAFLTLLLGQRHGDAQWLALLYVLPFVPLTFSDQFFRAVVQGRGQPGQLNWLRIAQPMAYCLGLGLLVLAGQSIDVPWVLLMMLAALALSVTVGLWLCRATPGRFSWPVLRDIVRSGLSFHRVNLLLYGSAEFDKALVLLFLSVREAGLYAVALSVSTIGTSIVQQSLGLMLVHEMAAAEDDAARKRIFLKTLRPTFAGLLAINGLAAATAWWWFPLLFGADFASAVGITVLLLIAGATKGARQMVDKALRAIHVTNAGTAAEATSLIILATVGALASAQWRLTGLAAAMLLSQVLALVAVIVVSRRSVNYGIMELWPFQRSLFRDFQVESGRS